MTRQFRIELRVHRTQGRSARPGCGKGFASVGSKLATFAEKKNAKSAAPPRVLIAVGRKAGAARNGRSPAEEMIHMPIVRCGLV